MDISIHSAARAETRGVLILPNFKEISIHSAARAETTQPHITVCKSAQISIHSAARAETGRRRLFHFPDIHFNPLRREGGDWMLRGMF